MITIAPLPWFFSLIETYLPLHNNILKSCQYLNTCTNDPSSIVDRENNASRKKMLKMRPL